MDAKVILLKEISSSKISAEDETEVLRLEPNDEVIITHTDNIQWCMVQTTDGQEGWFAIDGFDKIRGLKYSAYPKCSQDLTMLIKNL